MNNLPDFSKALGPFFDVAVQIGTALGNKLSDWIDNVIPPSGSDK